MSQPNVIGLTQSEVDERTFISQVYLWMTIALVVTAIVAAWVATDLRLVADIFSSPLFFVLLIGELAMVVLLGLFINRMSATVATVAFFAYAALNGVTFSIIFLVFTDSSITSTFLVTAGTFGLMSAYGYFTKRDLTRWGNLLLMGLIGFILASVVNLFLRSSAVYWIVTYGGIRLFVGLTAYDTQKIKRMAAAGFTTGEVERKASIIGALTLYLDFINLFLLLLQVLGGRRR